MMDKETNNLPTLLDAKTLQQAFPFSRTRVYELLNMIDAGFVVQIGRRKYVHRDNFLKWLDEQTKTSA